MKVEGGRLHKSAEAVAPKCQKFLSSIKRKQKIDLDAIGSQANNNLVDLLRCQCRAEKICKDIEKSRNRIQNATAALVWELRKTCGDELETLFNCAMKDCNTLYASFHSIIQQLYRQYELHIQYCWCYNYISIFDSRNTFQIEQGRYLHVRTCKQQSQILHCSLLHWIIRDEGPSTIMQSGAILGSHIDNADGYSVKSDV
jgi:hypothetical protein